MPIRRAASSNEPLSEIAIRLRTCVSVIFRSSEVIPLRSANGVPTSGSHSACLICMSIRVTRAKKIEPAAVA